MPTTLHWWQELVRLSGIIKGRWFLMSSTDTSGVKNIGGVMIKKIFVDLYLVSHSRIVSGRVQPIPVETKTRILSLLKPSHDRGSAP